MLLRLPSIVSFLTETFRALAWHTFYASQIQIACRWLFQLVPMGAQ